MTQENVLVKNPPASTGLWNHWFVRYKLYHIPFWFLYHYLSWALTIGSIAGVFNNLFHSPYVIKFFFYVFFQALGVYFNLYFLIPRFLEKGRYVSYISLVIITVIATALLILPGYYAVDWYSDKTFRELFQRDPSEYKYLLQIYILPSTLASMTLAMSIKLTKKWVQTKRKQQLLENEKLETELKFLRSQFNPHFLFNTINSIFVLINKNPRMASESLAKFSDLLRYQLYECNERQIPVEQELSYLENFIELEKLRQDRNLELNLNVTSAPPGQLTIAPFVLIPFIENAFKHVSHHNHQSNWINMDLHFNSNRLELEVENSTGARNKTNEIINYGGIGLQNVQRRLDLLYPSKYQLNVADTNDHFKVTLVIELEESKVGELAEVVA
jgi:sensor histidine kinase YesM